HDAAPVWHESLASVPAGPLLLVANEFLDALPILQYERRGGRWCERRVGLSGDGESLIFVIETSNGLSLPPASLPDTSDGSIFELCAPAIALAAALGRRVAQVGGAALFIDYGHTKSAFGDTLQAVRNHRYQPVLHDPGNADITAHVDFAAFATAARGEGAVVHGPVTQSVFLRALGIELRKRRLLESATAEQAEAIESGVRRLIDDAEMGTLFKVLAITHPALAAPAGFAETAAP
ncbi:MAG TPA: SAM-dependent methyltransferase, partial [Stellaceae bacterium]|nr:SAM-dependent methyltransferase [Stellaceae bacterium]